MFSAVCSLEIKVVVNICTIRFVHTGLTRLPQSQSNICGGAERVVEHFGKTEDVCFHAKRKVY